MSQELHGTPQNDFGWPPVGGEYDADAEWEAILSHPFGIAIFLGIFAGCLSPCRICPSGWRKSSVRPSAGVGIRCSGSP